MQYCQFMYHGGSRAGCPQSRQSNTSHEQKPGDPLVVQRLGLRASTAEDPGSVAGGVTKIP